MASYYYWIKMSEMFDYEYLITPPEGKDPASAVRYLTPLTTRQGLSTNYKLSGNREALVFSSSEPVLSTLEEILPLGFKYEVTRQPTN